MHSLPVVPLHEPTQSSQSISRSKSSVSVSSACSRSSQRWAEEVSSREVRSEGAEGLCIIAMWACLFIFVCFLIAYPWILTSGDGPSYCILRAFGFDFGLPDVYSNSIYPSVIVRVAITVSCTLYIYSATKRRGTVHSPVRRGALWYFRVSSCINLFAAPYTLWDFCEPGCPLIENAPTTLRHWTTSFSIMANWSWQLGTTLLLHEVVIAKVRLQQGPIRLLQVAVRLQVLIVIAYTVDITWLMFDLEANLEQHTLNCIYYFAVIFLLDGIFTVRSCSVLLGHLLGTQRALAEGAAGEDEVREMRAASNRLKLDFLATLAATTTGSLYYFVSFIFFYRSAFVDTGPWDTRGTRIVLVLEYWVLALDSATNDVLVASLVLDGLRGGGMNLEKALILVKQTAEKQRQRDQRQQDLFARTYASLGLVELSADHLRALIALEARVRSDTADDEVRTDAWSELRALCSEEQSRLANLISESVKAYELLEGRMSYILVIRGFSKQTRQPMDLPDDTGEAVKKMREEGERLRPAFERFCARMAATFNAAERVEDLGVDPKNFKLSFDQANPLPAPPPTCDASNFPITGSNRESYARLRAHLQAPDHVKRESACLRKVRNDYASDPCPASLLCDIVRVTVVFADPYHLAVFYEFVSRECKIVRVKNRFREPLVGSEYRDIMLNMEFIHDGVRQIVEMQLALEVLSALKKYQHKPYEVLRHDDLAVFVETPHIFEKVASERRDSIIKTDSNDVQTNSVVARSSSAPSSPSALELPSLAQMGRIVGSSAGDARFANHPQPSSYSGCIHQEPLPDERCVHPPHVPFPAAASRPTEPPPLLSGPVRASTRESTFLSDMLAARPELAEVAVDLERSRIEAELEKTRIQADVEKHKVRAEIEVEKLRIAHELIKHNGFSQDSLKAAGFLNSASACGSSSDQAIAGCF